MHPLLSLSVFGLLLLPVALMLVEDSPLESVPHRSVPYQSNNTLLFREEGVFDYSTMLLREDLDLLVVGARGEVFALNLTDVTKKISSAKWEVSKQQVSECKRKGKNEETDCKNYIRVLHKREDGRMYVCGTNAFDPECHYMSFSDGKLTLQKKAEDGKGKCPFDPFQRHASIMIENDLYSATSMNFLGSEPVLMRSAPSSIRTEIKSSWLYDPNFVSMAWMPESKQSEDGDDDKVYLFFSETAVEYDCYRKLVVSRVARVCKGDLGGERTLQKRWTSFLKARLDCPIPGYRLPFIIQDSYRWCDSSRHWKDCIFYAVFTPQSEISDISAVCAYRMSDISKVFSEGKYKTPASVETSFIKWVIFSGEVPVPRPGACINNEARKMGINQTLQLPDRTLQFIRDKPLMDQAIEPIGGVPVLSRRGAKFTQIIVNQVQALDGEKYNVMFIGTDQGTLLKAFRYSDGEMIIIEEVQLFSSPQPVKILQFSNKTGQIYAGSDVGVVQLSPANCERSSTCKGCVSARDPYCGWDSNKGKCVSLSGSQSTLIQNMNGNSFDCKDEPAEPSPRTISLGEKVELNCPSLSNLAKLLWMKDDHELQYSPQNGPLILNGLANDAGLYRCFSVEKNKTGEHRTLVASYQVSIDSKRSDKTGVTSVPQPQSSSASHTGLICVIIFLACCILLLLTWMSCKSRLRLLWDGMKGKKDEQQQTPDQEAKQPSEPLVAKTLNNHNSAGGDSAETDAQTVHLSSMQFIDDESSV
ncbi:PREDICTED: semaphorin-4E-like isoform X1 [Cyprinodon variegatus]|uniref:Semaphorin 4e n=2 Tax=Cyprinodon variegatus TaxID=28743 RepID=A0A3Q2DSA7_CYPVA|nr:PREDICTED: semaphorin-4E-like isoform X1 [Cyprinodon variegatus]